MVRLFVIPKEMYSINNLQPLVLLARAGKIAREVSSIQRVNNRQHW